MIDLKTAKLIFGKNYSHRLDKLFEETGYICVKVLFSLLDAKPASGTEGLDVFIWPQGDAAGRDPQARGIDLLDDEGDASTAIDPAKERV